MVPILGVVSAMLFLFVNKFNLSCGKVRKNPLRRKDKSRYRNASLTVEASLVFPVFFFAILYLIQTFVVLQAELAIAEAGIASARDAAAFSYAADRLADGENVVAEELFELFDKKLVRDAAFTTVFYTRYDEEILKRAGVAQGLGGMWVDTEKDGNAVRLKVRYRVKPVNVFLPYRQNYYCLKIVYRNWVGEGKQEKQKTEQQQNEVKEQSAYLADNATVYHLDKNCTYINIKIEGVMGNKIGEKRNAGGAKYYACEFCEPVLQDNVAVYTTKYGTRYHAVSSCSAIERSPQECSLEEAKKKYRGCKKCSAGQESEEKK